MKKVIIILLVLLGIIILSLFYYNSQLPNEEENTNSDILVKLEISDDNKPNEDSQDMGKVNNNYEIQIKDFAFSDKELRIKKGDSITWINIDSVGHTVTSDSGSELNSKLLSKNENYQHTFY